MRNLIFTLVSSLIGKRYLKTANQLYLQKVRKKQINIFRILEDLR